MTWSSSRSWTSDEPVAEPGDREPDRRESDAGRDSRAEEADARDAQPDQVAVLQHVRLGAARAGERARHEAQTEDRDEHREAGVARAEVVLASSSSPTLKSPAKRTTADEPAITARTPGIRATARTPARASRTSERELAAAVAAAERTRA